jgi:hypothetical protein
MQLSETQCDCFIDVCEVVINLLDYLKPCIWVFKLSGNQVDCRLPSTHNIPSTFDEASASTHLSSSLRRRSGAYKLHGEAYMGEEDGAETFRLFSTPVFGLRTLSPRRARNLGSSPNSPQISTPPKNYPIHRQDPRNVSFHFRLDKASSSISVQLGPVQVACAIKGGDLSEIGLETCKSLVLADDWHPFVKARIESDYGRSLELTWN